MYYKKEAKVKEILCLEFIFFGLIRLKMPKGICKKEGVCNLKSEHFLSKKNEKPLYFIIIWLRESAKQRRPTHNFKVQL